MDIRVAQVRRAKHMTQAQLAYGAGISVRTVQHIEAGTTRPQLATAIKIAEALGCGLSDLLDGAA